MEDMAGDNTKKKRCSFYDNFQERAATYTFPSGIYTLEDLKVLG